jgi:hypothetical protein
MSNFSPKLEEATEQELRKWINEIHADYASLASAELNRRQFDKFDKTTPRFSTVLGLFAVMQIVIAIIQIVLN